MDPILVWSKRDASTGGELLYDQQFVYNRDNLKPVIKFQHEDSSDRSQRSNSPNGTRQSVYANPDLIDFYLEQKRELYVPAHEIAVFERAHPFSSVHREVDDVDLKSLSAIFNLQTETRVVVLSKGSLEAQMTNFINTNLIDERLPHNFLIGVDGMLSEISLHFAYMMSKLYSKITLLQPAVSTQRYLICLGFIGFDMIAITDLKMIANTNRIIPLTKIFAQIPQPFVRWLTTVNNVHLGIQAEVLANTIESKRALDRDERYWPGVSYDIKRVINLLSNQPVYQEIFQPPGLKLSKTTDERIGFGLHLFGEPEDFTGTPIHTVIDFANDERLPYESQTTVQRGGTHWGQRKLLLAEIDFFTQNTEQNEKSIAFYIGAAPFDHGVTLAKLFPKINFWLCDPRNVWNAGLEEMEVLDRVVKTTAYFDLEFADKIAELLKGDVKGVAEFLIGKGTKITEDKLAKFVNGVTNFFFLSDIRRTDQSQVGKLLNEWGVHEDMKLQLDSANRIAAGLPEGVNFMSSLKFRLPFIEEIGGADYPYGKGSLHTQVWSRPSSTELRLWYNPKDGMTTYNKSAIEQILMYHNTILRSVRFGKLKHSGYCECHDCHYEVAILEAFNSKINVIMTFEQIFNMINDGLKKSLEEKSTEVVGPVGRFYSNPKYNAAREIQRAALYYRNRETLRKLLGLDDGDLTSQLIDQFNIYLVHTHVDLTSDEAISALAEIMSISIEKATQVLQDYSGNLAREKFKGDDNATLRVQKLGKAAYNISAEMGDKKIATISFHKSLLRRFLIKNERDYDLTDRDIQENQVVLARAFSVLKRYGSLWNDHFGISLDPLYTQNPELPGLLVGGGVLSTQELSQNKFDSQFTTTFSDLELDYGEYTSFFDLKSDQIIIPSQYVTVFYPNIKPLWRAVGDFWKTVLKAHDLRPLTVVFVIPAEHSDDLIADTGSLFKSNNPYNGNVYDNLKDKEVSLGIPHNVVVLSTTDFKIKL